jgi:protocatechuate 3,4-dioxygenase beta subunit
MSSLRRSFGQLKHTLFAAAAPLFATLLLGFICSQTGSAQVLFGSIVGSVTDASGAGVPGASVKITETSTNENRAALTNEGGFYTITTVTAGTYNHHQRRPGAHRGHQRHESLAAVPNYIPAFRRGDSRRQHCHQRDRCRTRPRRRRFRQREAEERRQSDSRNRLRI